MGLYFCLLHKQDNGIKALLSGSDEIFSGYTYFSELYNDISGNISNLTLLEKLLIEFFQLLSR